MSSYQSECQLSKWRKYLIPTMVSIAAIYCSYRIGFNHGYKEGLIQIVDKFNLYDLLVLPEIFLKYQK